MRYLWIVAVFACLGVTMMAAAAKTAKDGVFTAAQAKRGQALFKKHCESCHSSDLTGGADGAPALVGTDFLGFWDNTPVADLVSKIKESMPQSAAGTLTAQQATDVTAYVLQVNKFTPGSVELPSSPSSLKAITLVK
jgi:mono/diheme cytochrome c family protein